MERKKIIVGMGILLILFLVLLLWPKSQKREETGKKSFETAKIDEYLNREVIMPDYLNRAEELNWMTGEIKTPESMVVYKVNEMTTSEEEIKKFVNLMELDYGSKKNEQGGTLLLFNSKDNKHEANVDLKNNKFRYSENIYSKSAINNTGNVDIEKAKNKLTKLVEDLTDKETKINIDSIDYQEMVNPRWVSTTKFRAQAVEITASYMIGNYPVRNYGGSPVKATYTRDGRLIKLELEQIRGNWEAVGEETVVDQTALKRVDAGLFRIWKVTGNKDYQLKMEEEVIKKANLTNISLGYMYDAGQLKLRPFYFIEGNSMTDNGLVNLTIIFPATKSD